MKEKSLISQVLKRLMFERELKTAELARLIGMPQPTLHRIVEGTSTRPHSPSLVAIANYFGLSLEQLRGEVPIPWLAPMDLEILQSGWQKVPLIEWLELAQFTSSTKKSLEHEQSLAFKPIVLSEVKFLGVFFALKMPDASMDPLFPINSTLIFDEGRQAKDRDYVLIHLKKDNRYVFRQLILDGQQTFIRPLSPDLREVTLQALDKNDQVCGVLVQSKQEYQS
jgi:SOS-response transcriptional repressor LexA